MKGHGPNVPQGVGRDDSASPEANGGEASQIQQAAPRQSIVDARDREVRNPGPIVGREIEGGGRIESETRHIKPQPPIEDAVIGEIASRACSHGTTSGRRLRGRPAALEGTGARAHSVQ